jgi:hypothetical protein
MSCRHGSENLASPKILWPWSLRSGLGLGLEGHGLGFGLESSGLGLGLEGPGLGFRILGFWP